MGYEVFATKRSRVRIRGRYMNTGEDFFRLFDGIGWKDALPALLAQWTTHRDMGRRMERIRERMLKFGAPPLVDVVVMGWSALHHAMRVVAWDRERLTWKEPRWISSPLLKG